MNRDAQVVILEQTEALTREFHRLAAQLRARGHVVHTGDELIAYRVQATVPEGPVLVTDSTRFVFTA